MQSLNEQLAALKAEKDLKRDPALTTLLNRATEELSASWNASTSTVVGDRAPLFARPNLNGRAVRLRSLLAKGPVIVSFFRGRW